MKIQHRYSNLLWHWSNLIFSKLHWEASYLHPAFPAKPHKFVYQIGGLKTRLGGFAPLFGTYCFITLIAINQHDLCNEAFVVHVLLLIHFIHNRHLAVSFPVSLCQCIHHESTYYLYRYSRASNTKCWRPTIKLHACVKRVPFHIDFPLAVSNPSNVC